MKRYGLRVRHAMMIEKLIMNSERSLGANQIKHLLWGEWGRSVPTPRQIGIFLHVHPNIGRAEKTNQGHEYMWND